MIRWLRWMEGGGGGRGCRWDGEDRGGMGARVVMRGELSGCLYHHQEFRTIW
jgi:hypothetical protein